MLLAAAAALAQDATPLDPPLPIAGDPAAMEVTAYALMKPDPTLLVSEDRYHVCRVVVSWSPDTVVAVPQGCPDAFGAAAMRTALQWTLAPVGEVVPTKVSIDFVLHYDATIGVLNTSAELDPGPKELGAHGAPGLRMVHQAAPKKPITSKLPKGGASAACTIAVSLDARPKLIASKVDSCPEALAAVALKAVQKAKWSPRVVDGANEAAEIVVEVGFKP